MTQYRAKYLKTSGGEEKKEEKWTSTGRAPPWQLTRQILVFRSGGSRKHKGGRAQWREEEIKPSWGDELQRKDRGGEIVG